MADLGELLVGELGLERLDEALSGLAGRIGDHVQLDEAHGPSVLGALTPLLGFDVHSVPREASRPRRRAARRNRSRRRRLAWGGRYPTGDVYGSTIQINVSDTYPVDPALPQDWATFLGSLVHGRELASLTVDLAPLDEVQNVCGPQALACYDPDSQTIEASPEDQLDAPAAKEIVTHEYGHHVANNSLNTPVRRRGVRHEALGVVHEHLQARRRAASSSPATRATLPGEPRRGATPRPTAA